MSLVGMDLPIQEKKHWFILYSDTPSGPFSFHDLLALEKRDEINLDYQIWMPGWKKGISFKTLKSAYVISLPPLPTDIEEYKQPKKIQVVARSQWIYSFLFVLSLGLGTSYILMQKSQETDLLAIKPSEIIKDSISSQASAVKPDDSFMRLETLKSLSLKSEETFFWLSKEKFNSKKFKLSVLSYEKGIGSHLMQIYLKNESDFLQLSQKLPHNDPVLYAHLKTSLIAKKIGALTSEFIGNIQKNKNPSVQKKLTQKWLDEMSRYREKRFEEN